MSRQDVWTGVRADYLTRQHINHCRKRMREWTKKENQLQFELDTPQAEPFSNLSAKYVRAKRPASRR